MNQRVLIVDDNEDVRRIFGLRLQHAGFEVGNAADGAQGLVELQRGRWDLILLDLVMPRMDGFRFLLELRRLPAASPPVVVITQYDDAPNRRRALALGASHCVAKSRAFERCFVATLRQWLHPTAESLRPQAG